MNRYLLQKYHNQQHIILFQVNKLIQERATMEFQLKYMFMSLVVLNYSFYFLF